MNFGNIIYIITFFVEIITKKKFACRCSAICSRERERLAAM